MELHMVASWQSDLFHLHSSPTCKTLHNLPCIIIYIVVEELKTNLMSLVIFITLNICSTCFEH